MTLGEKLYELRTAKGLSQLELAEALDVSRQSVSKWETGSAVPEIDKLVALSRYFGVSVGKLLGVEGAREDGEAAPEAPESGSGELTEAQLNMVEEIVDRYVAALPKPMPKRQKLALKLCASMAAAGLLLTLGDQARHLAQLDSNYNSLQYSIENVNRNVSSQIGGISNRVRSILEEQHNLLADSDVSISSADLLANTVTFAMRATPKTFVEGMTARFDVDNGGESLSFGPIEPEGTTFAAEMTMPLTDETLIYLVLESGGTQETQKLGDYNGLYSATFARLHVVDSGFWTERVPDGGMNTSRWYAAVDNASKSTYDDWMDHPTGIVSYQVGLFCNRRLVAWGEPSERPSGWQSSYPQEFYRFPDGELAVEDGDTLFAAAYVTDEYGREYLCLPDYPVYVCEGGVLEYADNMGDMLQTDLTGWDFTPVR